MHNTLDRLARGRDLLIKAGLILMLLIPLVIGPACEKVEKEKPPQKIEAAPSWTAGLVTAFRAIAALDPDGKIRNPDFLAMSFVSPLFWERSPFRKEFAISRRMMEEWNIGTYFYVNARTKHIDSTLREAYAGGIEQVVNLGAGYDSRALRFREAMPSVRFFEMDLPPTVEQKKVYLRELLGYLPEWIALVPIDFNTQTIEGELARAGYDPARKTFFIWEGVTMYITQDAVDSTLEFITERAAAGSSVVFDYIPAAVARGDFKKFPDAKRTAQRVAQKGEPMIFGIPEGEARAYVTRRGFEVVSDIGPGEMAERYLIRTDGMTDGRPPSYYRIMHARVD